MTAMRTDVSELDVVVAARPRSIISWSSIFAGALTALAVLVVLSVTALAAGLELAPGSAPGAEPQFGPIVASIITGAFIVIAFGAGGLTAVWAAGLVEPGPAILHGFLVWALALVLMLGLVALGAGAFGASASFLSPTFEFADAAAYEDAGWAAVLALALGAGSAVLGGLLATREEVSRVW